MQIFIKSICGKTFTIRSSENSINLDILNFVIINELKTNNMITENEGKIIIKLFCSFEDEKNLTEEELNNEIKNGKNTFMLFFSTELQETKKELEKMKNINKKLEELVQFCKERAVNLLTEMSRWDTRSNRHLCLGGCGTLLKDEWGVCVGCYNSDIDESNIPDY